MTTTRTVTLSTRDTATDLVIWMLPLLKSEVIVNGYRLKASALNQPMAFRNGSLMLPVADPVSGRLLDLRYQVGDTLTISY